MDGEYIYIYCVYGVLAAIVASLLMINFLLSTSFKILKSYTIISYKYNVLLFIIMSGGLIIAFTSTFVLNPRISYILALIVTAKYWEDIKNSNFPKT